MNLQRVGASLFAVIAVVSMLLAAATIWLFLTNPVTVANAVNEEAMSPRWSEVSPRCSIRRSADC